MADPFLELSDISKTYPGVMALDGVSLSIAHGEVVGLVGENGAGKSTLMKILGGVVTPDKGSIRITGAPFTALTVAEASRAGIAFVHQELNLFDNLDVAANVYIGREPVKGGPLKLIDSKIMHIETKRLSKNTSATHHIRNGRRGLSRRWWAARSHSLRMKVITSDRLFPR